MLRNIGIKAKIWIGIGVLGAGFAMLVGVVQWSAFLTHRHIRAASASLFPATLASEQAEAAFQRLTRRYNDAVVLQDKRALQSTGQDAQAMVSALEAAAGKLPKDSPRLGETAALRKQLEAVQQRAISTYSAMIDGGENISEATQQAVLALAQENKQIEGGLRALREGLSKDFEGELRAVSAWSLRERTLGVLLFGIALVCGVGMAVIGERHVVVPLRQLAARLKDIAEGEGDLTKRLDIASGDELGEVGASFNTFMEKLHGTVSRVAENAERVATASEEISASATQQARSADAQRGQTDHVAAAMQEMAATVAQVSQSSNHAAGAAGNAATTARGGGQVVTQVLEQMRAIAEASSETAQKVRGLGLRSDQIGEIVTVIEDIADQTNLLALNAAIEAARAGEQGRGFAVVADEVRKLAERTMKATREIAGMIKGIQEETRRAVAVMETTSKRVEKGVETTSQAGASLQQIIGMSQQVGEMVTQIATAATQQSSATEQVTANIGEIARITHEWAAGTGHAAAACQQLSSLALDLRNVVGQFRLRSGG